MNSFGSWANMVTLSCSPYYLLIIYSTCTCHPHCELLPLHYSHSLFKAQYCSHWSQKGITWWEVGSLCSATVSQTLHFSSFRRQAAGSAGQLLSFRFNDVRVRECFIMLNHMKLSNFGVIHDWIVLVSYSLI